ncbi:MAG: ABC transporter substrate-binding protein [Alphaproteobacteria bacterium]|nr:ABC transporter substrate-binding protein [Alphaproteobacteria bacterium]
MKKILTVVLLFLFVPQSFAQSASKADDVKKFVEEIGNKIVIIASDKKLTDAKKREKIIMVIDGVIDADWIARFVLGKNYKTATDRQRELFTKLYRDFMINTYGPKFKNYNGRKFTVNDVAEQGGFYVAKAEFLPYDSKIPISTDFRAKERNGKLVILDFIAEGISLIETQRSEFNSAISQKGMDKFLDDLTGRVANLKNMS